MLIADGSNLISTVRQFRRPGLRNVSQITLFGAVHRRVRRAGVLGSAAVRAAADVRSASANHVLATRCRPVPKPRLLILIVAYNAETTIAGARARAASAGRGVSTSRCWCSTIRRRTARSSRPATPSATARCRSRCTCCSTPSTRATAGTRRSATTSPSSTASTSSRWCTATASTRPSACPDLVAPLRDGEADAVFGSRMLEKGGALRGGMPLYKFVGNRILTWFQNRMLGASLSEFHSGYRVYSVAALAEDSVPAEHERLSFRHRDHHPVRARAACGSRSCRSRPTTATRSAASTASSTRADVIEGGDGGPVAAAGPVLRPPLRLRAGGHRGTRTTSRSSITRAPTRAALELRSRGRPRARSRLRRRLRRRDAASPAAAAA